MKSKKSRIRSAAKRFEREEARFLLKVDGEPGSPLKELITSTGRVGHLTSLGFDAASKHYCAEVKAVTSFAKDPGKRIKRSELKQIQDKAKQFGKHWVYILKFADLEAMHGISRERHAYLLECERKLQELIRRQKK